MTAVLWMLMLAFVAASLFAWRRRGRLGAGELASRPRELRGARLVYMEKQFRSRVPISLVARLDRAYRLPNGRIVLVELKTRWADRAYLSDVIQLSAQKLALESQTGEVVEPYAFVTVFHPTHRRSWHSHHVKLLDAGQMLTLARRREGILARRLAPAYAASERACVGCAFRSRCDRSDPRG